MTKTENPVPRSFLAPKPNGIACYAGWGRGGGVTFKLVTLSYHYHYCSFSQLTLRRTLLGPALSVRLIAEGQIRAVKEGRDQLKVSFL